LELFDSGENGLGNTYASNVVSKLSGLSGRKTVALVLIKNYDDTHGLKYKITGIVDVGDEANSSDELKAETILAAGASYSASFDKPWQAIKIEVKNETTDELSSCKVFGNVR